MFALRFDSRSGPIVLETLSERQTEDTAGKSQSSRLIPCAVHLESWQKLDCERHGGACLLLLSAVSQKRTVPTDGTPKFHNQAR